MIKAQLPDGTSFSRDSGRQACLSLENAVGLRFECLDITMQLHRGEPSRSDSNCASKPRGSPNRPRETHCYATVPQSCLHTRRRGDMQAFLRYVSSIALASGRLCRDLGSTALAMHANNLTTWRSSPARLHSLGFCSRLRGCGRLGSTGSKKATSRSSAFAESNQLQYDKRLAIKSGRAFATHPCDAGQ